MSPENKKAGVYFHGPVYGGSGYADENLHVVLGLAKHGIHVQLEPRGARRDAAQSLSPAIQEQLDALTKVRVDLRQSVFFISAPAHEFQPQFYNARREVTLRQFRNHFGSNSIFSDPTDPRIVQSVQVPGMPLDELFTAPVDLVKIDAEGCEPLIFQGMQEMIRRSPNIQILMEFAPHMIQATIDPLKFLNQIRHTGLTVRGVSYESKLEDWPDARLLSPEIHTVHLSRV